MDGIFLLSFHQLSIEGISTLAEYKQTPSTYLFLEQPSLQEEQLNSSFYSFFIRCVYDFIAILFLFKIYCFLKFFCFWISFFFFYSLPTKYQCTCELMIFPSWKYLTISKQTEGILPSLDLVYSDIEELLTAPNL